ncbi:hypothetical protein PROFUN_10210 [Planoprotostelium fungivorum]|uniref:Uncharacterized protein n=1 Tax=Planoprotostelium fungivorum TaxID=1890364 RepID=A0A2P6MQ72_9EUKA|nr:hypothetical protein PROFUN_10210 [Planoprotostelium fungivorum]
MRDKPKTAKHHLLRSSKMPGARHSAQEPEVHNHEMVPEIIDTNNRRNLANRETIQTLYEKIIDEIGQELAAICTKQSCHQILSR